MASGLSSKHKTKLCTYYLQGKCNYGEKCTFSHDKSAFDEHGRRLDDIKTPLPYKVKLCTYYVQGTCTKGDDCHYSHDQGVFSESGKPIKAAPMKRTFREWQALRAIKDQDRSMGSSASSDSDDITSVASEAPPLSSPKSEATIIEEDDPLEDFTDAKFVLLDTQPVVCQALALQNSRTWSNSLSQSSAKLASMVDRPGMFGAEVIKTCIENVDKADRPTLLNGGSTPALFYAIKQNSVPAIILLLLQGADPSHKLGMVVGTGSKISLKITPLMFAIMSASPKPYHDYLATIKLLLAFGATLDGIPKELTKQAGANKAEVKVLSQTLPDFFLLSRLNDHLQPNFRYWIERARRLGASSPRELEMVREHGLENLRRANFYEIGQEPACKRIQQEILSRLLIPTESRGPLIMAFAGPPGHGKTNLAKAMAEFAGTKYIVINCAAFESAHSLLGASLGYFGSENGSELNNHLAEYSGKVSIVVLDEIDKTTSKVRDALLTTLQEGETMDRRTNKRIDCRKTIFILCTNGGTDKINSFFRLHEKAISSYDPLFQSKYDTFCETEVRAALKVKFDAPMTSRISAVIAFMPFTVYEAQMATGECFYSIRRDLGPESQVLLNPESDAEFVNMLGLIGQGYTLDAGYRSIQAAADRLILPPVLRARIFPHTPLPPKPSGSIEVLEEIKITTIKVTDTMALCARMV